MAGAAAGLVLQQVLRRSALALSPNGNRGVGKTYGFALGLASGLVLLLFFRE